MNIHNYINENKERFLEELFNLLRIESVSADPQFKDSVEAAADYLVEQFTLLELDTVEKVKTEGHPIVYAEKIIDKSYPTILVYGHYDVQPADPYELWDSPPFEPIIKDDKIYARGACDDKGQMFMHLKAVEILMQNKSLKNNIKFVIEGEEEVGSDHLEKFIRDHKSMLQSDIILISDTGINSI